MSTDGVDEEHQRSAADLRIDALAEPPKAKFRAERYDDGLRLHRRTGNWIGILISGVIVLSVVVFFGICFQAMKAMPGDTFTIFCIVCGIAFVVSTWVGVYQLLGHEEVTLTSAGLTYSGGIRPDRTRSLPLDELVRVCLFIEESEEGGRTHLVRIETLGWPVDLAKRLSWQEREWLVELLGEWFLYFQIPRPQARQSFLVPFPSTASAPQTDRIIIEVPTPRLVRPSESTWSIERTDESLICQKRELTIRTWLTFVFLTSLIVGFWNFGIVQVFMAPGGLMNIVDWLIFTPFAIVGIAGVLIWLATLFSPLMKSTCEFQSNVLNKSFALLGFRRTRTTPLVNLSRLELRPEEPGSQNKQTFEWELHFIDGNENSVTHVDGMTVGEGRWVGQELLIRFGNDWGLSSSFPEANVRDENGSPE